MGQLQPSNRMIVGVAALLFGAVLFGVGLHHMVATGTCSSTGYSANYGPVPHCPKGTGYWFAFLFGGVFLVVIGSAVSGAMLLILPALFSAIGIGAVTVAFDSHAASGSKLFGAIFGGVFAAMGLIPTVVIGLSKLVSLRRGGERTSALGGAKSQPASPFGGATSQPDAIMGAYAASPSTHPSVVRPAAAALTMKPMAFAQSKHDPLDQLAKLAELHKSGALTDDEFNREKTKLLAEM